VARQARASGLAGAVVTLKLKRTDFRILTRRRGLEMPTQTARTLFQEACKLLTLEAKGQAYRLIGVGLSNLQEAADVDDDFFPDAEARARKSERVADSLRNRFGAQAVINARQLRGRSGRPDSKSPRGT
jgi:DNA polymerase-4